MSRFPLPAAIAALARQHTRRLGVVGMAFVASALFATPAMAQSSLNFKATFQETLGGFVSSGFACPPGESCGTGEVLGLGRVTENVLFGGCGVAPLPCDVRTITFADGSTLVTEEHAIFQIPGQSYRQPNVAFGHPFSGLLADTVDPSLSTDRFAGATGTLAGDVNVGGGGAVVDLSGTITLA
jgi:hypothetical protein